MLKRNLACLTLCACTLSTGLLADMAGFNGGHGKYLLLLNTFPDDSIYTDYVDDPAIDHDADLRLKFGWQANDASLVTDYQLIARHGDFVTLGNKLPSSVTLPGSVPDDDRRLFDLTRVVSQDDDTIISHRLDRLYVDITSTRAVARFGRQVLSWGNGLIYTPMDFFNPFDPAAVDKEYKTGDDMLYGQYLKQDGDDLQAVWVIRRNDAGNLDSGVDSLAAKYHGFIGTNEYDLLIAKHYDDDIIGAGGIINLGGAVMRGDITLTRTDNKQRQADTVTSFVTSLSYSWLGWGHNISGIIEYFYNGFGLEDGDYSAAALAANPELVERIVRGELFTLGRQYIAASAMIEMTPLWILTPNIFINTSDHSLLAQLSSSYDLEQNWQLLAALSVPIGASGTEYGGIDAGIGGRTLSTELNLFAQLAWYF